jgi:hypothetical protein
MTGSAALDRRTRIQALDRTQSGLPLKPGRCGTINHDNKRHGTTTLFAALDGRSSAAACSATGIRNSSVSSTRSRARSPAGKIIHSHQAIQHGLTLHQQRYHKEAIFG